MEARPAPAGVPLSGWAAACLPICPSSRWLAPSCDGAIGCFAFVPLLCFLIFLFIIHSGQVWASSRLVSPSEILAHTVCAHTCAREAAHLYVCACMRCSSISADPWEVAIGVGWYHITTSCSWSSPASPVSLHCFPAHFSDFDRPRVAATASRGCLPAGALNQTRGRRHR